jgi:hypothetical protein
MNQDNQQEVLSTFAVCALAGAVILGYGVEWAACGYGAVAAGTAFLGIAITAVVTACRRK